MLRNDVRAVLHPPPFCSITCRRFGRVGLPFSSISILTSIEQNQHHLWGDKTPLLGFTKLKEKLLDGTKTQTIRKPRKHPIKKGDKLFIYWKLRTKECKKLGEAIVTNIVRKKLEEITNEDAVKDGCVDLVDFMDIFTRMHKDACMDDEFDIITFRWTQLSSGKRGVKLTFEGQNDHQICNKITSLFLYAPYLIRMG